jgi:hypothetical protein
MHVVLVIYRDSGLAAWVHGFYDSESASMKGSFILLGWSCENYFFYFLFREQLVAIVSINLHES